MLYKYSMWGKNTLEYYFKHEKLNFYVLKILVDINLNLNSHVYLMTIVMLGAVL